MTIIAPRALALLIVKINSRLHWRWTGWNEPHKDMVIGIWLFAQMLHFALEVSPYELKIPNHINLVQGALCISTEVRQKNVWRWSAVDMRNTFTQWAANKEKCYLQVAGLLQLCPCLKYWGFSTTGIRVIPITTASGPASRVQGVIIPWLTWWRGLAESSSPLITATGPGGRGDEWHITQQFKSENVGLQLRISDLDVI